RRRRRRGRGGSRRRRGRGRRGGGVLGGSGCRRGLLRGGRRGGVHRGAGRRSAIGQRVPQCRGAQWRRRSGVTFIVPVPRLEHVVVVDPPDHVRDEGRVVTAT